MNRRSILWVAIPAAILALFGAVILALPTLVSSSANRSTIEALASSVTGRNVHIAGNLSLSLFPEPQLIAGNVTIDGNDGEAIKARSLTLDIAMPALLRGQLTASTLILQSPVIAFPWPLPGGPAAIAPPPWLAALHAQISHGRISFGGLTFSDVSADIFTASGGAVSVSGSGMLLDRHINLTLGLGATDLAGQAPLAVQLTSGNEFAHFSGIFSSDNSVSGSLAASQSGQAWLNPDPSKKLNVSANLTATPNQISLLNLTLTQGTGALSGHATFDIAPAKLALVLKGAGVIYPGNLSLDRLASLPDITIHDEIAIDRLTIGSITMPHLDEISDISAQGISIASSNAVLPGGNVTTFSGSLDQTGTIHGQAHLRADNLLALTGSSSQAPFESANLTSQIAGTTEHLTFGPISGALNDSAVDGSAIFSTGTVPNLNGQFHLKQIDLATLSRFLQAATANHLTGNIELSADHAGLGTLAMSHFFLDAGINNNLSIRRISASLYNGIFAGSLTMQQDGKVSAAHAVLAIPSASPLASLLPSNFTPPATILAGPLAISVSAAGSISALATSAAITLGPFSITLAPVIDLTKNTAAGAVTLRHPSAIAAFKSFGLNAGLPWPGAGSIALRADMNLSSNSFGLPNFVISMGDLTAAGDLTIVAGDSINGSIDADTLALPPIPTDLSAFWKILPTLNGKIGITANRVWLTGTPWLGAAKATLNMQPGKIIFNIAQAALASGFMQGNVAVAQTIPQPPSVTANIAIQKADLSQLTYPFNFPLSLTSGIANLNSNVTANGFTPQTWLATLSGPLTAHVEKGTISGFNLAGLAAALSTPNRITALKQATQTGTTNITTGDIAGNFNHGIFKLDSAKLQDSDGTATATGSVDLSDDDVALNFGLLPNVTPPLNIGLAIIGNWSHPQKVPTLKSALAWQKSN